MSDMTRVRAGEASEIGPPIDISHFRREMAEAELEDIVDELVEAFLEDAPGRMVAIETAVGSARTDDIRFAAHAYKSGAASMYAKRLADLLCQLESAGSEGDSGRAAELLPVVRAEHDATLALLSAEFGAARSSDSAA
jgi:HPt (histidine-containing phosphotransfer) domain-containing protein